MGKMQLTQIKCGVCKKASQTGEKDLSSMVQCSYCSVHFHVKCAGVTAALNDVLQAHGDVIFWKCRSCRSVKPKNTGKPSCDNCHLWEERLRAFEESTTAVNKKMHHDLEQWYDARVCEIESRLRKTLQADLQARLDEFRESFHDPPSFPANGIPDVSVTQHATTIAAELQARDAIRNNVIVTGLKENATKTPAAIQELLTDALELPKGSITVTECKVLPSTEARPSRTLIKVANFDMKKAVLAKATTLRNGAEQYRALFINPDLTKAQQHDQYLLRQELKKRNSSGKKWRIKGQQLVPITEPGQPDGSSP